MTYRPEMIEFFTVNEACEFARIGRSKLYDLLTTGELKARKLGSRTLIEVSALQQWAAKLPEAIYHAPGERELAHRAA